MTLPTIFTEQEARSICIEVKRLATKYPAAIYRGSTVYSGEQCLYDSGEVENGPPGVYGCIFGQAMQNLGLLHKVPSEKMNYSVRNEIFPHFDWINWALVLQNYQDIPSSPRRTWGEALEEANAYCMGEGYSMP